MYDRSVNSKAMPSWTQAAPLLPSGASVIAGVDEVGRGCWAGPVVAAAVVMPFGLELEGVTDSKLMSPLSRERADVLIRRAAGAAGIGWSSPREIDELGLSQAIGLAGRRALEALAQAPDAVLLDGKWNYLPEYPTKMMVGGDRALPPVAAASVLAKVARDRYMQMQEQRYPGYGFGRHVGYGTTAHKSAVARLGLSPLHRRSVRVKELG